MKRSFLVLLLLTAAMSAEAATLHVSPSGDGDYPDIQAALDAAEWGDVVELATGTYLGPGNRDLDCHGKSLTIQSENLDAKTCIIDCMGKPGEPHRAFHFQGPEGSGVQLRGLTITGGATEGSWPGDAGGGILCSEGASPRIEDCIFTDNRSGNGGGICCISNSSPQVIGCVFKENHAVYYGGGIYCYDSSAPIIEDCCIDGNTAGYYGGGLRCSNSAPDIRYTTFCRNRAIYGGAGMAFSGQSDAKIEFCSLIENITRGDGGGIYCYYASPDLSNTLIAFNDAEGIFLYGQAQPQLAYCDLYGNQRGDWSGDLAAQLNIVGNLNCDPEFCGIQDPGEYFLQNDSPCAPGMNLSQETIGAWNVGCENFAAEDISWSKLKSLH